MKRKVIMLTLVLALGIAIGMIMSQLINAQQPPANSPVLLRMDLSGIEVKEGAILLSELPAKSIIYKHYHPGHQFSYVLEGSLFMNIEGKPPVTYKEGDTFYLSPNQVHYHQNMSTIFPVKVLVFSISDKGQSLLSTTVK